MMNVVVVYSLTLSEFRAHTELDPDPTDGEFTDDEATVRILA